MTTVKAIPQGSLAGHLQRYQQLKADIHKQIVAVIDISGLTTWTEDRLRREVQALATQLVRNSREKLSEAEKQLLIEEIMAEVFGLGPLEQFMKDPTISDILVNGPNNVYVERLGRLEPTGVSFADNSHLIQVIQRITSRVGRRIDESSPMVDARLPDGSRVNAILPPLALEGAMLSIRRFGVRLAEEHLVANGTLTEEMVELLRAAVQARINILISGGTGAGKTTFLNVLSRHIPHDERLVSIEDAAELHLQQPHVVRLETRLPNLEGVGEITQRDLVRNSLRMRPDRIIIGEVRGAEALDMLQAMNTGHEGSLTTIHANDTRDALARLEMMITMAGFEMPLPVIRSYVQSAVRLLVHVTRLKGGARKVARISELRGLRKGRRYVVRDLFEFRQTGVVNGQAVGAFHASGETPSFLDRLHSAGIDLPGSLFTARELVSRRPSAGENN
ncbi:MAG: CpaF family protein [Gemmataceae bacterium]